MKVFKSFNEFLNESLVTEAADKFKIKATNPDTNAGEVAVFKVVLREFEPQASLPKLTIDLALARPEFKKLADDLSLIAFMDITKERDAGALTPRELLKGAIIFKKAEGFDKTKATPLVKVGNFEVFDAKSAAAMKAGDTTDANIKKNVAEIEKDKELIPVKPTQTTEGNAEFADIEKIDGDADVLNYLKGKLLSDEAVKFSKSGKAVSEIKGLQALISKFKRADKKTNTSAATKISQSGIDGIYGTGTATAIGLLMKDGKPKDSITVEAVANIASWCKVNGMLKADVEKIFNDNMISAGGGGNNPSAEGAKYYFVNKGWTYSDDANPYKK
jgi:hypothetical protein